MRRFMTMAILALAVGCRAGNGDSAAAARLVEVDCPMPVVLVYDKAGEDVDVPIKVRHGLPRPATVKAETGCGCLTVDCPPTPLAPGEWLPLSAHLRTRPEIARRDVWLTFEPAGARPVIRRVPTAVAMYPYLEVDPTALLIESHDGEPGAVSLRLRMNRPPGSSAPISPRFLGVPANLHIEKVELAGQTTTEFGVVSADWTVAIRGHAPTDVSRETDEFYLAGETDRPPVRVAVVYARTRAVLAVPSRHFFGSVPREEAATCRSIVQRRDGKPFHLSEIRSSNPSFQATLSGERTGDGGLTLRIRFRPTHAGAESGTITMRTDAPDSPEVTIAVEGSGE
jgi:hypothetical protein